jgi:hypothetical protein
MDDMETLAEIWRDHPDWREDWAADGDRMGTVAGS